MCSARVTVWTLLLACLITPAAVAQSLSPIGEYLLPWGVGGGLGGPLAMRPDGSQIAFVSTDAILACCTTPSTIKQRISLISPDGTGYQIIVGQGGLNPQQPDGNTWIRYIRIAGDGKTITFTRADSVNDCVEFPPIRDYLVDVETGAMSWFTFNGNDVGFITFTDGAITDGGSSMVFIGSDPLGTSWGFYKANPDGSGADKFLDVTAFGATPGVISGDGSKFLFLDIQPSPPFPGDVYLYDLDADSLLKLNPQSLDFLLSASFSSDGSRVVYGGSGPLYAVNGDGSNHRVLTRTPPGGSATISRDGEYVYFVDFTATPWVTMRIDWLGTQTEVVGDGFWTASMMDHLPISGDGSIYAHWDVDGFGEPTPLAVAHMSPPVLTTYGFGLPGTTLTWDVGGEAGDSYILAMSLNALIPGAGTQYGLLELDPSSLLFLDSGPIVAPNNVGTVQITIPPSLNLPVPVPVHFQALVQPRLGGGNLTNRTTVDLQNAGGTAPSSVAGGAGTSRAVSTAGAGMVPWSGVGKLLTPEELMRRLLIEDPKLATEWLRDR